ncbi:hypothetical protein EMIT0P218_150081 [Pseudomonas sp. IT-P218]|uniref:DUF7693 family protein n=1 Tax=unclassified Pseudomonas TaxID=196821 RepID=UPI0039F160D4
MSVEIDGWRLTLFNDCDTLDYCEYCRSPDGRVGTFELWQRDGADSVELLNAWERNSSSGCSPRSDRFQPVFRLHAPKESIAHTQCNLRSN